MADWNLFHALGGKDKPENKRWRTYTDTMTYHQHVIPLQDTMHHPMDGECDCKPTRITEHNLTKFIHNAMDGREPDDGS